MHGFEFQNLLYISFLHFSASGVQGLRRPDNHKLFVPHVETYYESWEAVIILYSFFSLKRLVSQKNINEKKLRSQQHLWIRIYIKVDDYEHNMTRNHTNRIFSLQKHNHFASELRDVPASPLGKAFVAQSTINIKETINIVQ